MKKKILVLALVVAIVAIAVVGASWAYFTDEAEVTNTFTLGKVGIDLTEEKWEDGQTLFPAKTYEKDPTITVDADSEDCYLVATVTISNRAELYALYEGDESGVLQSWGLSLAGNGKLVDGGVAGYDAAPAVMNGVNGTVLSKDGADVAFITYAEDADADTITYTYYFLDIYSAGDSVTLFESVTIPAIVENDTFTSAPSIVVNAYAIQAEGFADVFAAYAEF